MENINSFNKAISYLSAPLKKVLLPLPDEIKRNTFEVRLRLGRPLMLCGIYGARFVTASGRISEMLSEGAIRCCSADIESTFKAICSYSVHSNHNAIKCGYVTLSGGHRAGICGTAATENGSVDAVRDISSINLRISREFKNVGAHAVREIALPTLKSCIIAGAPASGKTTLLRDITRRLADGSVGRYYRVVLADERNELAAVVNGMPQNDVGVSCDVLTSYPKKDAVAIALRSMSPDVIIMDEVVSDSELEAIETGVNSGVKFIVSVHASSRAELIKRPQLKRLINTYSFEKLLLLSSQGTPCTIEKAFSTEELLHEISGDSVSLSGNGAGRPLFFKEN